ncbi:MAG TPA: hypothetical protein VH253_14310 [Phycisphaerae bacterium]|nr:hypothetical protein [Phycisphaerae bacterium]
MQSPFRSPAPLLPLLAALPLCLGAHRALAQAAAPQTPPGATPIDDTILDPARDNAAGLLGPLYKDERAGIEICPPAGSRMVARAGLELVSFVQDQKQWGGSIQRIVLKDPTPLDQYLQLAAGDLSKTFSAVQILDSRKSTFDGNPAGRLTASMVGTAASAQPGGQPVQLAILRQQLLVQAGPAEYIVLTLFSPLKDRDEATRTFDAMIGSFEVMDPTTVLKRRELAVAAGKTWLAQRSADELRAKMLNQPQLFRTRIGGKDYGYVQFSEFETPPNDQKSSVDGLYGFFISIDSRSFPPDDPKILSVFGHNYAFWAYKKTPSGVEQPFHSVWDNLTTTNTLNPKNPAEGMAFWIREAGVLDMSGANVPADERARLKKERDDLIAKGVSADQLPAPLPDPQFHMHVTWTGDPTQPLSSANRGIDVDVPPAAPAALPKVLEYTWPRLVDLSKPSEMSFVVYNNSTRKLALRTLSVRGHEKVIINGQPTDTIKCTDEMDPGSTIMWVNASGKILMMRTSDQTLLTPTTVAEMQTLWKGRLK